MLSVVALAQSGYLPLHDAAQNNAGLDVVEALLQAHTHAAAVANRVRAGAARGVTGVYLWGKRECTCTRSIFAQ